MRSFLSSTVASAAFAGLFNLSANAGPAEEIEAALANIKIKGTPSFFTGEHSKNFNHLKTPPKPLEPAPPAPVIKVENFSIFYREELSELQDICPALKDKDPTKFDALKWFSAHVPAQELPFYRRDFIEAAYYTIGYQPKSPEKTEAIAKLNFALPDSAAFVEFLEKKKEDVRKALETDSFLMVAKASWDKSSKSTRERTIAYASRLILNILLKDANIDHPKVHLLNEDFMDDYNGLYDPNYNEMYLNDIVMAEDFDQAMSTTAHETYHVFQSIVSSWHTAGLLKDHIQLDRQGKLYAISSSSSNGTSIPASEHRLGYRFGIDERAAWGFAAGVTKKSSVPITQDMFTEFREDDFRRYTPPIYKQDKEEGRLPAACLG